MDGAGRSAPLSPDSFRSTFEEGAAQRRKLAESRRDEHVASEAERNRRASEHAAARQAARAAREAAARHEAREMEPDDASLEAGGGAAPPHVVAPPRLAREESRGEEGLLDELLIMTR